MTSKTITTKEVINETKGILKDAFSTGVGDAVKFAKDTLKEGTKFYEKE